MAILQQLYLDGIGFENRRRGDWMELTIKEVSLNCEEAVRFYLTHGYRVCENYGKYKGREEAICFEKEV